MTVPKYQLFSKYKNHIDGNKQYQRAAVGTQQFNHSKFSRNKVPYSRLGALFFDVKFVTLNSGYV